MSELLPEVFSLKQFYELPTPEDFELTIDGKQYYCQKSQIAAVSPKISSELSKKPFFNSFEFQEIKDPHHYFPFFIRMLRDEQIGISFANAFFFNAIATILEIQELKEKTNVFISQPITEQNIFLIVANLSEHNLNASIPAKYIANNWKQLSLCPEFYDLPMPIVEAAILDDSFTLSTESELFDNIHEFVRRRGKEFSILYRHCILPNLNCSRVQALINDASFDGVAHLFWDCFKDRLKCNLASIAAGPSNSNPELVSEEPIYEDATPHNEAAKPKTVSTLYVSPSEAGRLPFQRSQADTIPAAKSKSPQPLPQTHPTQSAQEKDENKSEIFYQEGYELDGVIAELMRQYDPDVFKDVVILSGGGTKVKQMYRIFDYEQATTSWWDNFDVNKNACTKENCWIMIEFNGYTLELTDYVIASPAKFENNNQPRSWKIEGSNDGRNFQVIDSVSDCVEMNSQSPIMKFSLQSISEPMKYFRMTMISNFSRNSKNKYELCIGAVELFGILHKD